MEAGQDKELDPKLLSQHEVTHSMTLNTVPITQNHIVGNRKKTSALRKKIR
jgi:hypothetical protein